MREVRIRNFKEGMKVDNIDEDEKQIQSLLLLGNADIDWRTGAAVRRKGYSYFYKELPYDAKQIYEFVNTAGTSHKLVIMNDKLYYIKAGVPKEITNSSQTPSESLRFEDYNYYPFATVLNRCYFADDVDLYWFDSSRLDSEICYQLGVTSPIFHTTPDVSQDRLGYENVSHVALVFTATQRRWYVTFTPTRDITVDAIRVMPYVEFPDDEVPPNDISLIVKLTADNAGEPGASITNAIGERSFSSIYNVHGKAHHNYVRFDLEDLVELSSGTTYGLLVDVSENYFDWYNVTHVMALDGANPAPDPSTTAWYTGDLWQASGYQMLHIIGGGLDEGDEYNYAFTYVNNAYKSESAPTYFTDIKPVKQNVLFTGMDLSTDDGQVDKVRLYRTKVADDTVYYYVAEMDTTDITFWDNIDDDNLGIEMQCADHQRHGSCPVRQIIHWHNRIFLASDNDTCNHILFYSKILESSGLTGIAGDPTYDYFPQQSSKYGHLYGNDFPLEAPITTLGLQGVTADVANDISSILVAITGNEAIHVFTGGFDPQNPPQDLRHVPLILNEGILDSRTMSNFKGRLVFLNNNKEIKAFNGLIDLEGLSDDIQSLLDDVGQVYHIESYNNRLWVIVDTDNDNVMDTVYLINLQRRDKVVYHKYTYKCNGNDAIIHDVLKGQSSLYALIKDALNDYHIVQLESGTSDGWEVSENDGVEISMKLQLHYIRPARRAYWQEVGIRGYYPTSTIPTLSTTCTDLSGHTTSFTLSPVSTEDEDGHKHGLVMASQELSFLLESTGSEADEVREMFIKYRLEGE